jgi:hypothetical protein
MKLLENIFRYIENLVSRGDEYYSKIIKFSHIINILYVMIITIFGIQLFKSEILQTLNYGIQVLICVLLLFKFHPFREHEFKRSDSTLIFSSAVFLFFNLSIMQIINKYTGVIGLDLDLDVHDVQIKDRLSL